MYARKFEERVTPAKKSSTEDVVDAVIGASRALVAIAARSLAGFEEHVSLAQYRALVVLCSRGPQRVADLSKLLDVTPSTATRMCDRLVRKHLATRRREAGDRRRVRIAVTDAGRALVDEVTDRRRREVARILRELPVESREQLIAALRSFSNAAGEVPEQSWSPGWR